MNENFANLICNQNGFDSAAFYGLKAEYLEFMQLKYPSIDYFGEIHGPDDGCGPDFTVGGAKCDEEAKSVNDCEIIDYQLTGKSYAYIVWERYKIYDDLGGNCLKGQSSIYVHCEGLKKPQRIGKWSEWNYWGRCISCGEDKVVQRNRQCIDPALPGKIFIIKMIRETSF